MCNSAFNWENLTTFARDKQRKVFMMKNIFLILLCLVTTKATLAQISYDVTLDESTIKGMAYLISMEDQTLIDSTEVHKDGTIRFRGEAKTPVMACISSNKTLSGSTCMLVLDDSPLKMEKNGNGTMKLKKASELNENLQGILTKLRETGNKNVSLIQEYNSLSQKGDLSDAAIKRIKKQREEIKDEIKTIMQESMIVNRNNIIPVLLLQQGIEDIGINFAEKFLKIYPYKDRPSLKSVHDRIKSEKAKASGKMIDFTMPDITGKDRKLSDFVGNGKYILVDFWASWCGPCLREMPHVKAAYEKYKDKGFDIVGVSLDKDKSAWENAINRLGMEWNHLSDLKGWYSKGAQVYNIRSIPATILFDPEGNIIATNLRGNQLEEKLKEVLK